MIHESSNVSSLPLGLVLSRFKEEAKVSDLGRPFWRAKNKISSTENLKTWTGSTFQLFWENIHRFNFSTFLREYLILVRLFNFSKNIFDPGSTFLVLEKKTRTVVQLFFVLEKKLEPWFLVQKTWKLEPSEKTWKVEPNYADPWLTLGKLIHPNDI